MKTPESLTVEQLLASPELAARPLVDARSPSEFAEDHLPGAINLPVLDDAQRAIVGTLDRQAGAFVAKRDGAALVMRRIADMLEGPLADQPRDWSPVVYCWRGGNRSGSLATVLARIGWRAAVLEGGYRAWRQMLVRQTAVHCAELDLVVLAGPTGCGKTRLLQRAAAAGHQVLDLEALAHHRGSVLGAEPDSPQPSQKAFEAALWDRLRRFDPRRPVLVESESRKIGRLHLPDPMIHAMRASDCLRVDASLATRVALLRDGYAHFEADPMPLIERLEDLRPLHADQRVSGWIASIRAGDWDALVAALLEQHYDPAYHRSMARNYAAIGSAPRLAIDGADEASFDAALAALGAALDTLRAPSPPESRDARSSCATSS